MVQRRRPKSPRLRQPRSTGTPRSRCGIDRISIRTDQATGEPCPIRKRVETTSAARCCRRSCPGPAVRFINKALKKKESRLINDTFRRCGPARYRDLRRPADADRFKLATRAGISIAIDDMLRPDAEGGCSRAEKARSRNRAQYTSGLITDGERYNKVVDIWGRAGDRSQGDDGPARRAVDQDRDRQTVDQGRSTPST